MRTLILVVLTLLGLESCGGNRPDFSGDEAGRPASVDQGGKAKIEFRNTRHDFGRVSQGEKLVHTFIYRNTGDAPLLIYSARADCGCTVPEYDTSPLGPGKRGNLKVVFNTQGFRGLQTKTIHLQTNTDDGVITLAVRAMIE